MPDRLSLIAALTNDTTSTPASRCAAAHALAAFPDLDVVAALIHALHDEEDEVRAVAWVALATIGPLAIPSLVKCLFDGDQDVCIYAMWALRRIGPASLPTLIDTARNAEGDSGWWVVTALGELGDPAALPTLHHILQNGPANLQCRAAEALRKIGTPAALEAVAVWEQQEDK